MSGKHYLTDCGLNGIHWIPYGLHACHFYDSHDDLVESLVAFMLAGLYVGEKCLWITAPPLKAAEAREALQATWHGCAEALSVGALRIVDDESWGVDALLGEEEQALREGYRGLRVSGLVPCEPATSERLGERRILTLCPYDRHAVTDAQRRRIEAAHHCTFEQDEDGWQIRWPDTRASTTA